MIATEIRIGSPRVSPAAAAGSKGEEEGRSHTERRQHVDPLGVEIRLVDDSGNDDHGAEAD